jgi:HSP20 family protein
MLLKEIRQGIADPYHAISQIRDEIDQIFNERAPYFPPLNVWKNNTGAIVTGELPGVAPEDIHIAVEGETLWVEGIRKPLPAHKNEDSLKLSECRQGGFKRKVKLPFMVDKNKVQAKLSKGILSVLLPRAEEDIPQKIAVEAA